MEYHRRLDLAREASLSKEHKIGTTGRGIGPCYVDKVGRTGIKVGDLLDEQSLRAKLAAVIDEKNFLLSQKYGEEVLSYETVLANLLPFAEKLAPYAGNVSVALDQARKRGENILFEGAQGTQLDIDHGTYPFVTSSNTVAGNACNGAGFGPTHIDSVIGILKAYTTRVGEGPFPTELHDEIGEALQRKGGEFGATTGRKRRCGWLDGVVATDAVRLNGLTGLAITKLDVLSGQPTIKMATSYKLNDQALGAMPANINEAGMVQPVYEEMAGWQSEINEITSYEDLPAEAKDYVKRIEDFTGVEAMIVSVGPDREETLLLKDPFKI